MNFNVELDWKFVVALGATAFGVIFAVKTPADAVERVLIHAINTCQGCAIALKGDR